ncbi:hypothetical protein D3C73_1069770 [compost metagenome]
MAERLAGASLRPAHHGRQLDVMLTQPVAFFTGGELNIGAAPAHRPFVFGQGAVQAIPARAAPPIPPGKVETVVHAQASLLRRVHQEQAPERPERLAAKIARVFLVHQQNTAACPCQFVRRNQACEPAANDNDVPVHHVLLKKRMQHDFTNNHVNTSAAFAFVQTNPGHGADVERGEQ